MLNDRIPMVSLPGGVTNTCLADLLVVFSFYVYRYRQPRKTRGSLDLIPVSPISSRILHVVKQDKLVYGINEVKVSFPRYIVRLYDGYFLSHALLRSERHPISRGAIGEYQIDKKSL